MKGITTDALFGRLSIDLAPYLRDESPEDSPTAVSARALRDSIFKKLVSSRSKQTAKAALDKFLAVNERCGTWELKLSSLEDEILWGELRSSVHRFFSKTVMSPEGTNIRVISQMPLFDSLSDILAFGSLGPGASQGSDQYDFYTKLFDSVLTTTSKGLYRGYTSYIARFPRWQEAEKNRLELRGDAKVVEGGRITFVPKSDEIDRVICIEPVLNSFYQQGIRHILEERLKSVYQIDFSTQQEKNRELAFVGSKTWREGDWSPVTIDLSSASDSMSIKMLRTLIPSVELDLMLLSSSRTVTLPDGSKVPLNMISTMGNAFTFPLETLLFCCVVDAAFRVDNSERRNPRGPLLGNWGVFGDDIICPRRISRKVLKLLDILGFQINSKKTFLEGPFRESCGADFYDGVDVRPVFCEKLDTIQDLFSLINRLNQWSYRKGIPLRRTVGYLLSRVPRFEVPPWENVDCGVHTPFRFLTMRRTTKLGSFAYRRWVPKQSKARIDWEREVLYFPWEGPRVRLNPDGLYLSFLRGNIVNGVILLRPKKVHYTTKAAVAPNWDISPTTPSTFCSVGGLGLESLANCTFWYN